LVKSLLTRAWCPKSSEGGGDVGGGQRRL
jgi:hypothetical protein